MADSEVDGLLDRNADTEIHLREERDSSQLSLNDFVTYRMARVLAKLNAQASHILKTHCGLSLVQWRVIALLANGELNNLNGLASASAMDKGQLSRKIKSLVEAGYLTSQQDEKDHRAHIIKLTPAGEEIHRMMLPVMRRRQAYLTADLSEDEIEQMRESLLKIENAADRRDF